MPKLITRNALQLLLYDEDYLLIWLKADYSKEDRSRLRYRLAHGQLSLEKMEEILTRCGFTVAQEKIWTKPIM